MVLMSMKTWLPGKCLLISEHSRPAWPDVSSWR